MLIPTIETARLVMRPFNSDDVEALYRVFTDPGVRRYLLDDQIVSREWIEEEIAASAARFEAGSAGLFCLYWKDDESLIGFCGFRPFFDPPELQLLYGLLPDYWSKGIATEAARAMIDFGFERLGFERITAAADAPNIASLRVLEKVGMVLEKRNAYKGTHTVFYVLDRKKPAKRS